MKEKEPAIMKHVFDLKDGRREPIKDLFDSERIIIVDQDTAGAKDVTFAYCRFEAKTAKHKKHVHPHAEEIIYILSGKGISGLYNTETEMSAGQTMFVPRKAVHWFYNPFDEPVEMLFIYTRPSLESAGYEIIEG